MSHLLADAGERQVDTFLAIIHVGLGEPDRALESLERACDRRAGTLTWLIKADPRFDPLRELPRCHAIQTRMVVDSLQA